MLCRLTLSAWNASASIQGTSLFSATTDFLSCLVGRFLPKLSPVQRASSKLDNCQTGSLPVCWADRSFPVSCRVSHRVSRFLPLFDLSFRADGRGRGREVTSSLYRMTRRGGTNVSPSVHWPRKQTSRYARKREEEKY